MSKIDCSITENFLKEWGRMCDAHPRRCVKCPIFDLCNPLDLSCDKGTRSCISEILPIVQKWSDEHPVKTIKDDFLEKYPNAEHSQYGGVLKVCAKWLGYFNKDYSCPDKGDCNLCWNTPLSEVQK
jgi:hypothetical protein